MTVKPQAALYGEKFPRIKESTTKTSQLQQVFSHDVTAAILVYTTSSPHFSSGIVERAKRSLILASQNNKTAAMLVF